MGPITLSLGDSFGFLMKLGRDSATEPKISPTDVGSEMIRFRARIND